LREDALRTPDARFVHLIDYPWAPHYLNDLPTLQGLRLHYLNEGSAEAACTFLCLHDGHGWSYDYRKIVSIFVAAGQRVVAPDLVGFGKSDKPKKETFHSFSWHRDVLLEWVEKLDLNNVVLIIPQECAWLGLSLPMAAKHRYKGLLLINSKPDSAIEAARRAPFPDEGHRAAPRAFATDVSLDTDARIYSEAQVFWQSGWRGRTLASRNLRDGVSESLALRLLQPVLSSGTDSVWVHDTTQGLTDQAEPIAKVALEVFGSNVSGLPR
jgi:tRNA(adenine34) deaminase